MDIPTMDALPTSSESRPPVTGDAMRSAQAVPGGAPTHSSPSDAWEKWPHNHPSYFPLFDAIQHATTTICTCGLPRCRSCDETRDIFHISEYTAGGREITNGKINTSQLRAYLEELDKLYSGRPSSETAQRPSFRLFFLCDEYFHDSFSSRYIHHFFAYFQTPPHFVLNKRAYDVVCPLQIATGVWSGTAEAVENQGSRLTVPSTSRSGSFVRTKMLYILVQLPLYVPSQDHRSHLEYYSEQRRPYIGRLTDRSSAAMFVSPTLYLCYSFNTRDCTILVAESSPIFHHLRQFCASPNVVGSDDPFVFVVAYLEQLLAYGRYSGSYEGGRFWRYLRAFESTSVGTDNTELFRMLYNISAILPTKVEQMATISLTIERLKHEHKRFLDTSNIRVPQDVALMVDTRLDAQLQLASQLRRSYSALSASYQRILDMLLGYAQIQNGIATNKIAINNQKQAEATEALARDSRRDSEIMKRDSATMKTITVVTLVYLPATFVSTLLSMGMFDFGVGSGGDGRLQIARQGWIFLAISLPLTALTLSLAYLWRHAKERQWSREAAAERRDAKAAGISPTVPGPQEHALENTGGPAAAANETSAPVSIKARISGLLRLRRRRAPPADLEAANTAE